MEEIFRKQNLQKPEGNGDIDARQLVPIAPQNLHRPVAKGTQHDDDEYQDEGTPDDDEDDDLDPSKSANVARGQNFLAGYENEKKNISRKILAREWNFLRAARAGAEKALNEHRKFPLALYDLGKHTCIASTRAHDDLVHRCHSGSA